VITSTRYFTITGIYHPSQLIQHGGSGWERGITNMKFICIRCGHEFRNFAELIHHSQQVFNFEEAPPNHQVFYFNGEPIYRDGAAECFHHQVLDDLKDGKVVLTEDILKGKLL